MDQWEWQLYRQKRAQEQWEFYLWIGAACLALLVLILLYRRLGRWQGIQRRIAHARAQGLSKALKRDLRQGLIIGLAVLAALLAWSALR